jgi:cytochrome P450
MNSKSVFGLGGGAIASERGRIPPGPQRQYAPDDVLLQWMGLQFAEFGDIFKASIYGTSVYAVRDLAFARHVLVENWRNYVKGQFIKRIAFLLGNGLMVSEGELWKRQRRMIQPAFHPKSVGALIGMIATVNYGLLQKWRQAARQGASINLTHDVSGMALEVILRAIFGEDYALAAAHFKLISDEAARDWAFAQSFRALRKIIIEVTERRRREPLRSSGDFLDVLIDARDPQTSEPMSDRQIVNEVLTLIVAGHETTASTLNWTWYLLSRHPEAEQKLFEEARQFQGPETLPQLAYSRRIMDESMRLYPAGWLMTRKALNDDWLGDFLVPAGTEIYVSPYFIQRHPKLWDEPDLFDPDRFLPDDARRRATMPFSAGPRNCIGESFARAEMQLHLLIIARHLRLRYEESQPVALEAGVNLRGKHDFIMHPEARA